MMVSELHQLRRHLGPLALLGLCLLACTSNSGGGGTGGSVGPIDGAAGGGTGGTAGLGGNDAGSADAAACNSLVPGGAFIGDTAATGPVPSPAGGAVADGTYVLTRHDVYPPSSPGTLSSKETFRFAGLQIQYAQIDADTPATTTKLTLSYAISGTRLQVTRTCGATGLFFQDYTATADALLFIDGNDVLTYTKQ